MATTMQESLLLRQPTMEIMGMAMVILKTALRLHKMEETAHLSHRHTTERVRTA
jgi:hypothetical protein